MIPRTPEHVLAIVPVYLRAEVDLAMLTTTVATLQATAPELEVLVVDDGSPATKLVDRLVEISVELSFRVDLRPENAGFSRTVNVGLDMARERDMHALLVNADMEFTEPGWVQALLADDAWVTGGRLLYPNGTIQHAGVFFSLLHRSFDHIYRYAPANLPEALTRRVCPVTGALQLIDHQALEDVGLYDPEFRMGFEDVDYCVRVFLAGQECAYVPTAVAVHHESMFRAADRPGQDSKVGRWEAESWAYFARKYARQSFSQFIPSLI